MTRLRWRGLEGWRPAALAPRHGASLVALVCAAWGLSQGFGAEVPTGRVVGRAVRSENQRPLAGVEVYITAESRDGERWRTRYATTDADGSFEFPRIPAGEYEVSASAESHRIDEQSLTVDEGGVTTVTLALTRTEPDLAFAERQQTFVTTEPLRLPVRGYVDAGGAGTQRGIHVRAFRARLSNLVRDPATRQALVQMGYYGEGTKRLPEALLRPVRGASPTLVVDREVRITEADREGAFYQRIDLGKPGPGAYLVEVSRGSNGACAWVLVTDTAVVSKRAAAQVLAYAANMRSGVALAGTRIVAYRGSRPAATGTTGPDGIARLAVSPGPDSTQVVLVATRGADEAVVGWVSYVNEARGRFAAHTYTDRPIYRPGQRLSFKGIVRRVVEPGATYSVPAGMPVTVELRDPSGERLLREPRTTNQFGSFAGAVDLSPEAPTGTYTLATRVGGEEHTDDITVAAYHKPEFTATVSFARPRYVRGETMEASIAAQYYFGTPVAGGTVRYSVYREADWRSQLPGDASAEDDEGTLPGEQDEGYGEFVSEGELTLDENGRGVARIAAQAPGSEDAPDDSIYTVHAYVKDPTGREGEGQGAAQVVAGAFRLQATPAGYLAAPGRATEVALQARDYEGRPVSGVALTVEMGYERWRRGQYHYALQGRLSATTAADGSALVTLTPARDGDLRVTVRAVDSSGRSIRARTDLWVSGDEGGDLGTEYQDLSLMADRRTYLPGQTARVLVNASRIGQAVLLTVEGDHVYRAFTVPVRAKSTVVRVPILATYGPNVSLAACYVRQKRFASSEMPLRVRVAERDLHVTVRADRRPAPAGPPRGGAGLPRYQPRERITYTVDARDARGRPTACEFSLGVVDEAIYALQEDDPRALRRAFYPRRQNRVATSTSIEMLYFGDADKSEPRIEARTRFLDTAFWAPMVATDSSGHARVTFALPDNLTTWRATVLAQTTRTQLGRATTKVIASKPFFVRVETPRFITQRDQSRVLVVVHNETGAAQTALVRVRAEGLTLQGETVRTLQLPAGSVGEAAWPVTATVPGDARLRVTAWTPRAADARQYTDGVETSLVVRAYGREDVQALAGTLTAANPENEVLRMDPAAVPSTARLAVRISPSLTSSLVGGLEYLVGFPYGCTEQTMSRFLPDLLVQRVWHASGTPAAARHADLPRMVRDGLTRLYRLQHDSGGWGWWEHDPDDPWMTAYVVYGLTVARAQGYPVSPRVLARGAAAALTLRAHQPQSTPFLVYAAALAGKRAEAMKALAEVRVAALQPPALAHLILLQRLLGHPVDEAEAALRTFAVSEPTGAHWRLTQASDTWSDVSAAAVVLRALIAVNPSDVRISGALRWLMGRRTGGYWYSTRDTAWVLAALSDYLSAYPDAAAPQGQVRVLLNGRPLQTFDMTAANLREPELVVRVPASGLRPGKNDVTLERVGGASPVFYSVEFRQSVGAADLRAVAGGGLKVSREYLRVRPKKAGQGAWTLQTEPTGNRLRAGDTVRVRLTMRADRDMSYVLVEDPLPAGCEVNARGEAEYLEDWDNWWSSTDVRDDRIAFFARTLDRGKHIIEYNLRAQTPGTFGALPTLVQPMYEPAVRSETAADRLEIAP